MKKLTAKSDLDQKFQSLFRVTSKSKILRLKNMLMLLHSSERNRMSINRMASSLNCNRRSVYRYCSINLNDKVQVVNGFIYLRHLSMAA